MTIQQAGIEAGNKAGSARRAYAAPGLVEYGSLAEITLALSNSGCKDNGQSCVAAAGNNRTK